MGARAGSPSTVVTSCPSICPAATRQEQTGSPSSRTVQAPQSPASQPTLVPVNPRDSRRTLDRRSRGETEADTFLPLSENATAVRSPDWGEVIVAMSGAPHTGVERALNQGQSRVVAVPGGRAYVINGREGLEMLE